MSRSESNQTKHVEPVRSLKALRRKLTRRPPRSLKVESLEPRRLLTADISAATLWGQYCVEYPADPQPVATVEGPVDVSARSKPGGVVKGPERQPLENDLPFNNTDETQPLTVAANELAEVVEFIDSTVRQSDQRSAEEDGNASTEPPIVFAPSVPEVVGSFVYHRDSVFSELGVQEALDTGKVLARESSLPQTLGFDNLLNTHRGIGGIVFDLANLSSTELSSSDFTFQMSPQGAFSELENAPAEWQLAPAPEWMSMETDEESQISRIRIEWPDQSIMNRWLRVTINANANTGLPQPEVFYLGHLIGKSTNWLMDPSEDNPSGYFETHMADIMMIRQNVGAMSSVNSVYDINKDGVVSFADIAAMRAYLGAQLSNITIPPKLES